jgi:deoxyribonuclease V
MQLPHLHDWTVTPQEAIALQNKLVSQVIYDRPLDINKVKLVAGVDVSVKENTSQAAVVVLSYPDLKLVEAVQSQAATPFPYIPGLLAFREGPVLENAFKLLQLEPDVFIFDGMGRAHPRRMGIATHMGLWLQKPTIGCGKTFLLGTFTEPDNERGAYSELKHKGEIIGVVLRTRANVKPVFISPGHLIDLQSSIALVMNCTTKYRLPEPIRMAHQTAGKFEK